MASGFHFVANLKPYTLHRGRGNDRFSAYLLSTDYARALSDLSREVVRGNGVLCADNGNVDLIRGLLRRHEAEALVLDNARREEEGRLGRYARPGDLSAPLRERFQAFAKVVRAASEASVDRPHVESVVAAQQVMHPTYLIGMEDFTVATLTGLGAEPEYLGLEPDFYAALAKRAVDFAFATQAGGYGPCDSQVFAGLHASDYDTARLVGRAAGAAGVLGIATGLVGALQDKSFVDFRVEDGAVIELGRAVPRPYLRVAEIAAGLHEGFVEVCGRRPRFHALGAGTPILLPLLAALGDGATYTATDSTSPIVDGWSGPTISLYVDEPAPLKYKAYRLAEAWLSEGRAWDCPCPYCRAFNRAYPPRIEEALRWWRSEGEPRLTAASVGRASPLSTCLPLLANADDPGLRLTAAMARVGHNHWVIQRIELSARRHSQTPEMLLAWVDGVVANYLASAADPAWKAAIGAAWPLVRRAAERMRGAEPSPL